MANPFNNTNVTPLIQAGMFAKNPTDDALKQKISDTVPAAEQISAAKLQRHRSTSQQTLQTDHQLFGLGHPTYTPTMFSSQTQQAKKLASGFPLDQSPSNVFELRTTLRKE